MHRALTSLLRRPLRGRGVSPGASRKSWRRYSSRGCPSSSPRSTRGLRVSGVLYQRIYPEELLEKSSSKERGEYQIDYKPAPRITKADKKNDKKSLQRALDRRLYLLLFGIPNGAPSGEPVWHFPEKVYKSEETLRKCAESALENVIGELFTTYFAGNSPTAHMVVQNKPDSESFKRFFFKSNVVGTNNKCNIRKCQDFVWATKDEILEHFPEQAESLRS